MTDGQRLAKAISFAAIKHADQTRKEKKEHHTSIIRWL